MTGPGVDHGPLMVHRDHRMSAGNRLLKAGMNLAMVLPVHELRETRRLAGARLHPCG